MQAGDAAHRAAGAAEAFADRGVETLRRRGGDLGYACYGNGLPPLMLLLAPSPRPMVTELRARVDYLPTPRFGGARSLVMRIALC